MAKDEGDILLEEAGAIIFEALRKQWETMPVDQLLEVIHTTPLGNTLLEFLPPGMSLGDAVREGWLKVGLGEGGALEYKRGKNWAELNQLFEHAPSDEATPVSQENETAVSPLGDVSSETRDSSLTPPSLAGESYISERVTALIKDGDLEAARIVRQELGSLFSGIPSAEHAETIRLLEDTGGIDRIIDQAREASYKAKLDQARDAFRKYYDEVLIQPTIQALLVETSATRQGELELTLSLYQTNLALETEAYIASFEGKVSDFQSYPGPFQQELPTGLKARLDYRDDLIVAYPIEFLEDRVKNLVASIRPDLPASSPEATRIEVTAERAYNDVAIRVKREIRNRDRFSEEMLKLQTYVDSLRTMVDLDIADPQIRSRLDRLYQTLQLRQDALEDDYISAFEANPNLTPRQYISDETMDDFKLALSGSRYEDTVGPTFVKTISNILKVPGEVREEKRLAPLSDEDALALIKAGVPVDVRQARDLRLQLEEARERLSAAEIAAGGRRLMPAMEEPVLDTPAIVAQREKVRLLQEQEAAGKAIVGITPKGDPLITSGPRSELAAAEAELERLEGEVTPVPGEIERERPAVEVAPTDTPELQAAREKELKDAREKVKELDIFSGTPPDIREKILRGEPLFGEEAIKYGGVSSAYRDATRVTTGGGETPGEQVSAILAKRKLRAEDRKMREEVRLARKKQEEAAYQEASRKAIAGITPKVEREQEEAEEKRERELKAAKPFTQPAKVKF
jgi:hypothetical protein